jgi:hypothetical protein
MDGGSGVLDMANGGGEVGFVLAAVMLTRATAALRGRDGSGEVRELSLNSPGALQVRKEEIGRWIRRRRFWKEGFGVGVRKKALLTHGATESATGMRTPARACKLGCGISAQSGRGTGPCQTPAREGQAGQEEAGKERPAGPMGQKPGVK